MAFTVTEVDAIFSAAVEISSPEERAAYIQRLCGDNAELRKRVEELLAAHFAAGEFLEQPPMTVPLSNNADVQAASGTVIGPYKLLQQIGEGGMGIVFMAEQTAPIHRTVALKVIKPGMDSRQVVARIEAERQALAMMDHPSIAKVLDAGTTESGRPYFVMDLVKGVPITAYCDKQRFTVRQRLELMTQICQAVQHAHQKGIIHRDLKPTNVLVAEYDDKPVPKVIDFGVAKATAQKLTERTVFTEYGQLIGTFEYMSPEQARFNQLDIDTRSDIYSLGVLLYELLTGSTPFERRLFQKTAFDEVLRIIREVEPPTPSTRFSTLALDAQIARASERQLDPKRLTSRIRGDLDWIVMKALEKDRTRRYATANTLAEDIEAYLENRPILARSPSAVYRVKKYLSRNLARVSFFAAALVASCIFALGIWTVRRERTEKAAALARMNAERVKAAEVAAYFNEFIGAADPYFAKGANYTVRELLDRSTVGLANRFKDQPEIEAEIRRTIADAYRGLQLPEQAGPQYQRLLELRKQTVGSRDELYADCLVPWGWHLATTGHDEEAAKVAHEALSIYQEHSSDAVRLLCAYRLLQWIGETPSAMIVQEALKLRPQLPNGEHQLLACILHVHAQVLANTGNAIEAEKLARQAVAMHRRVDPPGHIETAWSIWVLATALEKQNKLSDAEAAYREAIQMFVNMYGDRPDVAGEQRCLEGLIRVFKAQNRHEQAAEFQQRLENGKQGREKSK